MLLSKYSAVHLSSREMKQTELIVKSKALTNKPSSIFNEFVNENRNKASVSNSSRNSHDSHPQVGNHFNLTQPRFLLKKSYGPMYQNLNKVVEKKTTHITIGCHQKKKKTMDKKGNMKSMIKAACSRYES